MKIKIALLIILLSVVLIGCTDSKSIASDEIKIINDNQGKIHCYNKPIDNLTEVNDVVTFSDLNSLELSPTFNFIAFTSEYYTLIDEEFIGNLFTLLETNQNKIIIGFIDFPNYNFLKYTIFYNEKDHYPKADEDIKTFNNFNLSITQRNHSVSYMDEGLKIDLNIFYAFSSLIKLYNDSL